MQHLGVLTQGEYSAAENSYCQFFVEGSDCATCDGHRIDFSNTFESVWKFNGVETVRMTALKHSDCCKCQRKIWPATGLHIDDSQTPFLATVFGTGVRRGVKHALRNTRVAADSNRKLPTHLWI